MDDKSHRNRRQALLTAAGASASLIGASSTRAEGSLWQPSITRSQISSTEIVADTFITSGFYDAGDLGSAAIYTRKNASSVGPGAIQDAIGTWYNLIINGFANVGWFGAKGDGLSDDSLSIQAALNATPNGIYFPTPRKYYLTSTIQWNGQPIEGDSPSTTIIQGMPGKDVFYCPDLSIGEEGYVSRFPHYTTVKNVRINVDATSDTAFHRPVYPIKEEWRPGAIYSAGEYIFNSAGGIYYCMLTGQSGKAEPAHAIGIKSDGGCDWLFVDLKQLNVGNCAFAFPLYSGLLPSDTDDVARVIWDNVQIYSNGITTAKNNNGGIYSQRQCYASKFFNIRFWNLQFGICIVPPTTNFELGEFDNDTIDGRAMEFFCRFPYIVYNQAQCNYSDITIYAAPTGWRSIYLLEYKSSGRKVTESVVFNNFYCEPHPNSGQIMLIMGNQHTFVGGSLALAQGYGSFIVWAASNCSTYGTQISSFGNDTLQVWGNLNNFDGASWFRADTTYFDGGQGNRISIVKTPGESLHSDRALYVSPRTRSTAFSQDSAFVLFGNCETPFDNAEDLLIGGDELNWRAPTPERIIDSSLETGSFVRLTGNTGNIAQKANNLNIMLGRRVPRGPCRWYIKSRLGSAGSQTIKLNLWGPGDGDVAGHPQATFSMTTNWAIYAVDVDFTNVAPTQFLEISINDPTGNPAYLDIAWTAFRPVNRNLLLPDPSGKNVCELYTDGAGLHIKYANGTVKTLVSYP